METWVSMLQEDAVAPATAPPPPPKNKKKIKKIQALLVPCSSIPGGLRGAGGEGGGMVQTGAGGSGWSRSVSGEGSETMAGPQVPEPPRQQQGPPGGPDPDRRQPGVTPSVGRAAWPETHHKGSPWFKKGGKK